MNKDLMVRLFRSIEGDLDDNVVKVAKKIIESEKAKGHTKLANQLRSILEIWPYINSRAQNASLSKSCRKQYNGCMEIPEIKKRFRHIDLAKYPHLQGLTRDQIYNGEMGPGALILASEMSTKIPIQKNMRIMDLGCGKGATSIFLARTYGVTVYAVDLWIAASELFKNIQTANCENKVLPFNLDATKDLPFAENYFDVVFCMDAWHYFGANHGFIAQISRYLKPDGYIVVGNPCFDREFETEVPKTYEAFWPNEFSKYHSPKWWEELFQKSGVFSDIIAEQAQDGVILWEDALLHNIEIGDTKEGRLEADADEIVFGQDNPQYPYLTHYILSGKKI